MQPVINSHKKLYYSALITDSISEFRYFLSSLCSFEFLSVHIHFSARIKKMKYVEYNIVRK